MALSLADTVLDLACRRAAPDGGAWLRDAAARASDGGAVAAAFHLAARRVGRAPVRLTAEETTALGDLGVTWRVADDRDVLARVALLLATAARCEPHALAALVERCDADADYRGRQAVLRALPLLPYPGRFLHVALAACRTSILAVFEAIACDNPYAALHFHPVSFDEMVLRAVAAGLPLARIVGLAPRTTADLRRRAAAWAAERRATGRPVPAGALQLAGLTRAA